MKLIRFMLVEDSASDIRLTQEALVDSKVKNELIICKRGDTAVAEIRKAQPDMIILDLHLPGKHGLDVLAELKADPKLKLIPVVIMTSSTAEADVVRAYSNGSAAYCTKPLSFQTFVELVQAMDGFFSAFVKFPQHEHVSS